MRKKNSGRALIYRFQKAIMLRYLEEASLNLDAAEDLVKELGLSIKIAGDSAKYDKLVSRLRHTLPENTRARAEARFATDLVVYARDMFFKNQWECEPRSFVPKTFRLSVKKAGEQALGLLQQSNLSLS